MNRLITLASSYLAKTHSYSPYQFASWRILFGLFLFVYNITALPYVVELYSGAGVFGNTITITLFPNILIFNDSASFVYGLGVLSVLLSGCIVLGWNRPLAAGILWYIHACFFGYNFLTEDPTLAFIGLLLLMLVVIPTGEPLSFSRRNSSWQMPFFVFWGMLFLVGLGYTVSGIDKFSGTSWLDGSAMYYMYDMTIAYDNWLVSLLRQQPDWMTALQTWFAAGCMTVALPALLWNKTRLLMWIFLTGMFIFMTLTHNLLQVTLGMLLVHLFIFDPQWIPQKIRNRFKF